jgi:SAM-dependent methyltransferase
MSDDDSDTFHVWDSQCWFPPLELATLVAAGVLRRGVPVLDLGCGAGVEAIFLAKLGWRTYGIDTDPAMITRAKELGRRHRADARFHVTDVRWGRRGFPSEWPRRFGIVLDRLCINNVLKDSDDGNGVTRDEYFATVASLVFDGGVLVLRDRCDADEAESTSRRKFFEEADIEELLGDRGRAFFVVPPGSRPLHVRLVGDDSPDWNRLDAMIPIRGTLAILRRKPRARRRPKPIVR